MNIKKLMIQNSYQENNEITFDDLVLVHVLHMGFDNFPHKGMLIVNKKIAQDTIEIFEELYINDYQIEKIELIDNYCGDDNLSMLDNNTSAFNYRYIENTHQLSNHSYGLAIDINPLYNPYVYKIDDEVFVSPVTAIDYIDRELDFKYKIEKNDICYEIFTKHGFTWGGDWNNRKDYQHFEKKL